MNFGNNISKEEFEEFQKKWLDLDDEFQFECRRCGKCCRHQDTIIFTGRDVFMIAKKLNKTPHEVIKEYTEIYIGPSSRIPIVHLLPRGKQEECPFLKGNECSIHDSKPTVCALYPLGRIITVDDLSKKGQAKYLLQNTSCGTNNQTHTVRDWLRRFNIQENDEFFYLWNNILTTLSMMFRSLMDEKHISRQILEILWDIVLEEMYINYDIHKEFIPQFLENEGKLRSLCQKIEKLIGN